MPRPCCHSHRAGSATARPVVEHGADEIAEHAAGHRSDRAQGREIRLVGSRRERHGDQHGVGRDREERALDERDRSHDPGRAVCRRRRCTSRKGGEAWRACLSIAGERKPVFRPKMRSMQKTMRQRQRRTAGARRTTDAVDRRRHARLPHRPLSSVRFSAACERGCGRARRPCVARRRRRYASKLSAIPISRSRRSISAQTSLGWTPAATRSTTRL